MRLKNNEVDSLTYDKIENNSTIQRKEIWKIIDLDSLWDETDHYYKTLDEYELENKTSQNSLSNNIKSDTITEFDRKSFL